VRLTSVHGTFRTWPDVRLESVVRAKADIAAALLFRHAGNMPRQLLPVAPNMFSPPTGRIFLNKSPAGPSLLKFRSMADERRIIEREGGGLHRARWGWNFDRRTDLAENRSIVEKDRLAP
jgi:hypothetical protein